jgi:hypothetical protein
MFERPRESFRGRNIGTLRGSDRRSHGAQLGAYRGAKLVTIEHQRATPSALNKVFPIYHRPSAGR